MSDKEWNVTVRVVGQANLSTVISALDGSATLIEVKEVPPATEKKQHGYVNVKRNKGISARDLVTEIFANAQGKPLRIEQIQSEFVRHGFASGSASPSLSAAVAAKKIRNLGRGKFEKM